jgi:glycosyltransferase involved in cell wall biosynthesis
VSRPLRLLYASPHCHLDPSGGASLCTRDVLELLAARGHDCRAVAAGVLDFESELPLEGLLDAVGAEWRHAEAAPAGRPVGVLDATLNGVRSTLLPTRSSRPERAPDPAEAAAWLDLAWGAVGRFRPDAVLTYGGHPALLELMRRCRAAGVPAAFHLHNFGYADRRAFADAAAVLFPSEYARRWYRARLGLDGPVVPDPVRPGRVVAPDPDPRYLVFVNPQPAKGVTVFARVALELQRLHPEVPVLVVEGRGGSDWLTRVPVDLSGLGNLHRMANTPEPRDFWRVARAAIVPSLWRESLGRVPMEAMANGVPVLASDRGALPETLGDAGFVLHVPGRYTPDSAEVPTAGEVAPWVAAVGRLWSDAAFEAGHRERARREAARWDIDVITSLYEHIFTRLAEGRAVGP